ncbi:hypothetical protein C8Q78DRAFT_1082211 [Trametes maxima]|nr:hypothetical protein C8Q78DRAFT_1082211 [Trametes maxima]
MSLRALQHVYDFRLPQELLRMVFSYFEHKHCRLSWLASVATVCKAFYPEAEAALYRWVAMGRCSQVSVFCRSVVKRSHRAVCVRTLVISVRGGSTIRQHLQHALPLLTNVSELELVVDDSSLFDLLLCAPFRLRCLVLGGVYCPLSLEDILASQPYVRSVSLEFVGASKEHLRSQISRPDLFPHLDTLAINTTGFSFTLVKHPYPIAHLSLNRARHDDIAHAIKLLGPTLVSLKIVRFIDGQCTSACFWPTSMFTNARLPRLQHVDITDTYDPETELARNEREMSGPGLGEACPALETFSWGMDERVMLHLYILTAGTVWSLTMSVADAYANVLFACFPALTHMGLFTTTTTTARKRSRAATDLRPHGRVFEREDPENSGAPFRATEGVLIDFRLSSRLFGREGFGAPTCDASCRCCLLDHHEVLANILTVH